MYNAQLGAAYLAVLEAEFGKSIVLVPAAYNAGPSRARRWQEERGNPAAASVDVVDWIEHVPFTETRNYVMRVAESMAIYRARLSGVSAPLGLTEALRSR
jgi:soluble lytic murein transglycosylase